MTDSESLYEIRTKAKAATTGSLAQVSDRFHAFEWLRSEALNGNTHASVLLLEISRLNAVLLDICKLPAATSSF
jgi:hypothetical protein